MSLLTAQPDQALPEAVFHGYRELLFECAGIYVSDVKKALIVSRLFKRVKNLGLNYREYLDLVRKKENLEERQVLINLLTTNETHFFREPEHFEFLRQIAV